jgi:hypothetical protein
VTRLGIRNVRSLVIPGTASGLGAAVNRAPRARPWHGEHDYAAWPGRPAGPAVEGAGQDQLLQALGAGSEPAQPVVQAPLRECHPGPYTAAKYGEPFVSLFRRDEMEGLLVEHGFDSIAHFGAEDAVRNYFRGTDVRIPDVQRLVTAVVAG